MENMQVLPDCPISPSRIYIYILIRFVRVQWYGSMSYQLDWNHSYLFNMDMEVIVSFLPGNLRWKNWNLATCNAFHIAAKKRERASLLIQSLSKPFIHTHTHTHSPSPTPTPLVWAQGCEWKVAWPLIRKCFIRFHQEWKIFKVKVNKIFAQILRRKKPGFLLAPLVLMN